MSEQPRIDLSAEQWHIVRDILRQQVPDCEVWAFGSRVAKAAKRFSDLDILVKGAVPPGLSRLAALREALTGSPLPFKVDIVDWTSTEASFREIIDQHKVLLQDIKN